MNNVKLGEVTNHLTKMAKKEAAVKSRQMPTLIQLVRILIDIGN